MKKEIRKSCVGCNDYEPVGEGFGLCLMDEIPVTVIADYQPTKNHLRCQTAYRMQSEGWCDDCQEDVKKCIRQSMCEGYRRINEKTD